MTNIAHFDATRIVVGVDTHKDEHVAVAINGLGARLGEYRHRTTPAGYADLRRWATGLGDVAVFGPFGRLRAGWAPARSAPGWPAS